MREVVVMGVGLHKFGRFPDATFEEMTGVAISKALADSGVPFTDIEAALMGSTQCAVYDPRRIVQQFGWTGIPIVSMAQACASSSAAFREGYLHVASGVYDCVLLVGFEKMERGFIPGTLASMAGKHHLDVMGLDVIPARVAIEMRKRMAKYGETIEPYAEIAAQASEYGLLNPNAHYQERHTREEVMNSRMICDPLTLYMCCPTSDGASAAIICSKEKAKQYGLKRAVSVAGYASGSPTYEDLVSGPGSDIGGDFKGGNLTKRLAPRAYAMAGVGPEDIKVAQVHDPFSMAVLVDIEALGFCKEGEGGRWIMEGNAGPKGKVPLNTDGGLLSKGHPTGASGLGQIAEIVKQLRGEAGDRQIPGNPKVGLTHNSGAGMINMHIFKKNGH